MRNLVRFTWLAALASIFLIASPSQRIFAQGEDPEAAEDPGAAGGNPTGISGIFNGQVETGCSYDPLTNNGRREITDIIVPGGVGAYPLKFTRTYNLTDNGKDANSNPAAVEGNYMGPGWRYSYTWTNGLGGLVCPDGRRITSYPYWPSIEEQFDADGNWVLSDGGKVHFGYQWNPSPYCDGGYCYASATQIIDPYGQVTTIEQDPSDLLHNRIIKVTEPGGRYLEFTYYTASDANYPEVIGWLKKVEAFAGVNQPLNLSVTYIYERYHTPNSIRDNFMLQDVVYSDGTTAHYEWRSGDGNGYPSILSFTDSHYNGPMRELEYGYNYAGAHKHTLAAEKSFGVPVSSIVPTPSPTPSHGHTTVGFKETRGDGATRTFTYILDMCCYTEDGWYYGPFPAF